MRESEGRPPHGSGKSTLSSLPEVLEIGSSASGIPGMRSITEPQPFL